MKHYYEVVVYVSRIVVQTTIIIFIIFIIYIKDLESIADLFNC